MHIEYIGKNLWGVGHVLPAAFAAHEVCFRARRHCFVTLYDSNVNKYFQFQSGESWDIAKAPLVESMTKIRVANLKVVKPASYARFDMLHVQVFGPIPFNSARTLASLPWDPGPRLLRQRACFFRYLLWPIAERLYSPIRRKNATLHLRTGFADGMKVSHRSNPSWFNKLCNWTDLRERYDIISDSPRLASKEVDTTPASAKSFAMTDSLFEDVMTAMLGDSVVTVKPSSFVRPLAIASCVRKVEDVDSVCPLFNKVFMRDMILQARLANKQFESKYYSPPLGHPCHRLRGHDCAQLLMRALL